MYEKIIIRRNYFDDLIVCYYGSNAKVHSKIDCFSSFYNTMASSGNYIPYKRFYILSYAENYVLSETFVEDMKQLGVEVIREA